MKGTNFGFDQGFECDFYGCRDHTFLLISRGYVYSIPLKSKSFEYVHEELKPAHNLMSRYVKIGSCRWSIQLWKVAPICFWGFSGLWIWWLSWCGIKTSCKSARAMLSIMGLIKVVNGVSSFERWVPFVSGVFQVAEFDGDAVVAQNLLSDWLECF